MMKMRVGFTTSFPVEVVFAAGHTPVDLNNVFILNNPAALVRKAELSGFPRNVCAWIKGMYSVIDQSQIDMVVGIVQGDCSNTHSLMAIIADENKNILPFSYPWDKKRELLDSEISKLENYFGVTREQTMSLKHELDSIREKLTYLDELTWKTNQVSSFENHIWLVSSSDFNGDYVKFNDDLDTFIQAAKSREPAQGRIRLGIVGVPPIIEDIYGFIEECDARVVFNEVQRQFSMFYLESDLIEQYLRFTYPYTIFNRIKDIKQAVAERKIDGLISYTQSFCHRQLDFISLKKHLELPILRLEADQPGKLDARTKLRIESFVEMVKEL